MSGWFFDQGNDFSAVASLAAAIHHPEEPWREPTLVCSAFKGMVLCKRVQGRVERGDGLLQIAYDAKDGGQ